MFTHRRRKNSLPRPSAAAASSVGGQSPGSTLAWILLSKGKAGAATANPLGRTTSSASQTSQAAQSAAQHAASICDPRGRTLPIAISLLFTFLFARIVLGSELSVVAKLSEKLSLSSPPTALSLSEISKDSQALDHIAGSQADTHHLPGFVPEDLVLSAVAGLAAVDQQGDAEVLYSIYRAGNPGQASHQPQKPSRQPFYPAQLQAKNLKEQLGARDLQTATHLEVDQRVQDTPQLTTQKDTGKAAGAELTSIEEEVIERDRSSTDPMFHPEDQPRYSFENEEADQEDEDMSQYLWDEANKIGLHTVMLIFFLLIGTAINVYQALRHRFFKSADDGDELDEEERTAFTRDSEYLTMKAMEHGAELPVDALSTMRDGG
mmetsp:Transcript_716/g.2663  ORF Transcript_716/g.2663 Transcript_716/m.2663 type:complete len:377 (+) Transcript_716:460-1590(+)